MSLVHVSAVAFNDSDATLKIGTSTDDDEFLVETAIGDSGTPSEFDWCPLQTVFIKLKTEL